MLRVTIELVPFGIGTPRTIGVVDIANDGKGTRERGNYMVRLARRDGHGVWKRGAVTDFPRLSLGPYDLLARALVATVGERNRSVLAELQREIGVTVDVAEGLPEAANEPVLNPAARTN